MTHVSVARENQGHIWDVEPDVIVQQSDTEKKGIDEKKDWPQMMKGGKGERESIIVPSVFAYQRENATLPFPGHKYETCWRQKENLTRECFDF